MFANPHACVTSVTSDPFSFLDADISRVGKLPAPDPKHFQSPFWEAMRQERADKSAATEIVQNLLLTAAAGGMSQKDFEVSAGLLRPARRSDADARMNRAEGFNGTLWNHYMTSKPRSREARMSLFTLAEYAEFFHDKGWISKSDLTNLLDYCGGKVDALASVKKMFPAGAPPDWEIERTARTYRTKRS